ncbi:MAG: 7-cyano-7-deazaguanine synthase QueC [Methanomassiliicoccales archaeon]|jgi:7-cyano-7-deazaguanine synthase|nr:7-cyano-7-deazaguanine synthase QueC [Methanomassiliicoccales archaeon]
MPKAVVLLSGGLDSTVTLAIALSQGYEAVPLSFRYGQRHAKELEAAKSVTAHYGLKQIVVDLDLSSFETSALTSKKVEVPQMRTAEEMGADVPVTYVPARNIIFLSVAAGLCETVGASVIFIGANAVDYSGYPDCRPEFFQAFEKALKAGTKAGIEGRPMRIETPILRRSKSEIVKLGKGLGAPLHLTWSCYEGREKACGRCDSCLLRIKGFKDAGYRDEIPYEVE